MIPPAESPPSVAAGSFGEWLAAMRGVLRGERDADVPCGDCIGCCVSSYPIPLRPEDTRARAEVPEEFLLGAAAPGRRWLMGFRSDGACPFMNQRLCGIYTDRPQTCRDYDCRIYTAAGLLPDGDRPVIVRRIGEWKFRFDSDAERAQADAVHRAAQFIRDNATLLPPGMRAGSSTAAAVLAVKTYPIFLADDVSRSASEMAQRVIDAARLFDEGAVAEES